MKLMSGNNSQVAMAREVKLATDELTRTLKNTLHDALHGLSDHNSQNLEAPTRHGFNS